MIKSTDDDDVEIMGIPSNSRFYSGLGSVENLLGDDKVKDFRVIGYGGERRCRVTEGYSMLCFF